MVPGMEPSHHNRDGEAAPGKPPSFHNSDAGEELANDLLRCNSGDEWLQVMGPLQPSCGDESGQGMHLLPSYD